MVILGIVLLGYVIIVIHLHNGWVKDRYRTTGEIYLGLFYFITLTWMVPFHKAYEAFKAWKHRRK